VDGRSTSQIFERWQRSPDGLQWTLSLRSGIKFHDGELASADAVRLILEPELQNALRAPGFIDVASIAAPDAATLSIRLKRPSAFLLDDLSGYSLERGSGQDQVGTGPFIADTASAEKATLHSFDDYFQGRPSIGRIELISYPTVRTAWAAMMRGEIDALYEVGRDAAEFVEAESTVKMYSFARPYVHVLGFNARRAVFRRPEVRQAISQAVDRNAILHAVLRDRGRVADGYVWPSHWAYDRSAPAYGYDPAAARATLDRLGLRVKEVKGSMPERFSFSCISLDGVPLFEQMSLLIQKQLYDVGVNMRIEPLPFGELVKRLASGDFDAFLFELASPRVLSWAYRFFHSPTDSFQPFVGWGYSAADAALDKIRYAMTDDEVRAGVSEFQRALYDDPPAAFITWDERSRAVSRHFIVPAEPGMDIFPSIWRWKAAPPARN
jgi:peptide/nickel transport system substrate-binding protein